jgi:lactate permease
MIWLQQYNPLGNAALSTIVAALPVVVLLGSIAGLRLRIHLAASLGLAVALAVVVLVYGMPARLALATTIYGAAYGLFPIGWIILNLIFLYDLTVKKGHFVILRSSLGQLAPDPRVQVILVAFSLGAFFEGAAGFGTPVAVTSALLMQLGFRPLAASGLSLIANTAPVAFGGLGTPILALSKATGISEVTLSVMIGRQLPFFSLIVPFWVVCAMAGFRGAMEVWPAALTAGLAFAVPQFLISNLHGPWLVDLAAAVCSMLAVAVLLRFWRPATRLEFSHEIEEPAKTRELVGGAATGDRGWRSGGGKETEVLTPALPSRTAIRVESMEPSSAGAVARAWMPWVLLSVFVFFWGLPRVKAELDRLSAPKFSVPFLDKSVVRAPPVVPAPTAQNPTKPEDAIFVLNWLSATGTGILAAAVVAGLAMGFRPKALCKVYGATLLRVRYSLITIAAMLALGYVTRYSGTDATLGLALARTGKFYPFFGTLLGWLGVALTGSDTASNVLFGSLQKITAGQTGISPTLMAAANSSGGVMGKMVDAQSIVVASTATSWYGHEGEILRYVFFHSLALAALVGILVFLQAYVAPFSQMVPPQ